MPLRGVAAFKTNIFYVTLQEFLQRKEVDARQTCEGCDNRAWVERKCAECDEWLCAACCRAHAHVRMSRDHHLLSPEDLRGGNYDELIKECFEPLACGRHGEPLKLYCCEATCSAPICTVCKSTDHVSHRAIALEEQADAERMRMEQLLEQLRAGVGALTARGHNLKHEDRITSSVRKRAHEEINARLEEVVTAVVRSIGDYAESLHGDVEKMAKEHRKKLSEEMNQTKIELKNMVSTQMFAESLLNFGKAEETVSMSSTVCDRLSRFKSPPASSVQPWRHPTLHPPREPSNDELAELFGHITFSGEVIKSVEIRSFSAAAPSDDKEAAITDVIVDESNNIVLVDKDNRKLKVFDKLGKLKLDTGSDIFKVPNRLSTLRASGNFLVKDDKFIRILRPNGEFVSTFASSLKQPVGMRENRNGEILITDWMTGLIHRYYLSIISK